MTTSRADALADAISATKPLLVRFLDGFDESKRTTQSAEQPNHVIWTLGHCAMTMHRVAEKFDGVGFPEDAFVTGDGKAGNAHQFDTESVCIGSQPADDPSLYPTLARGRDIYEQACDRFAATVRGCDDAKFDEQIPWHDGPIALWSLVARVCFHNGTHAGQLVDLRRALGMGSIIKQRA